MNKLGQKQAGRPSTKPKRYTLTLSAPCAEKIQQLADEAEVKPATYCAYVLERYALQGNEVMSNDVLVQRLENLLEQHSNKFANRFAKVMLRIAHELVALRRYMLGQGEEKYGEEMNEQLRERSWRSAVKSLHKHTKHVRGDENKNEKEGDENETY